MDNTSITFEMATHFLPKIALTIENACNNIQSAMEAQHPLIHLQALNHVIDLLRIIERPELKGRFLKELMKLEHQLSKDVSFHNKEWFAKLYLHIHNLTRVAGRFAEDLFQDSFLLSVVQITSVQNTEGSLSPQVKFWLNLPAAIRQNNLRTWLNHLALLQDTVAIYLGILRHQAIYEDVTLQTLYYQRAIPLKNPCHLISVSLKRHTPWIPKIQLGPHGLSIRFSEAIMLSTTPQKQMDMRLGITQF